jgi:hypothetical protein
MTSHSLQTIAFVALMIVIVGAIFGGFQVL